MAGTSTSAVAVYHGTSSSTSTSDVEVITMSRSADVVEVRNRASSGNLFVRIDGTTPVALAKENYIVTAGGTTLIPSSRGGDLTSSVVVRVISDTTSVPYTITMR